MRECVDALVEEVECEDTLDGVCVHGSQLLCFDVTDGDPSHKKGFKGLINIGLKLTLRYATRDMRV